MMTAAAADIRGIVFDLDGTLYVSDRFAAEIQHTAAAYVAEFKGIDPEEAPRLMVVTRQRLFEESGTVPTISAVCTELGGSVQELHRFFERNLRPEVYLTRDERVIESLARLSERYALYIYTNNNRVLTARIMSYLGLDLVFKGVFTIDESWRGKPDLEMLEKLLAAIGLSPHETLFVGDRYDVDLRLPEQLGCPVYLSQTLEQLLRLEELLIRD
jgi:putative hydrolase of the HAD superfamily